MQINKLIPDIYALVSGGQHGWFTQDISRDLSQNIVRRLTPHFNEERQHHLRMSKLGPICPKALWCSIHRPGEAEPLPPWAQVKYSFGHILEGFAISLAKVAGHEVTGEQDELVLDGITGHRDCVIDGCVVDVKSSSSRSFLKFKDKSIAYNDPFGYLEQLDAYILASNRDPLVRTKDRGYLLAIDKQLGHMVLYEHRLREDHVRRRILEHKQIVTRETPPDCTCGVVPDGKSGNLKLDIKASYSPFKFSCFPQLRTFLYSDGPHYLHRVERLPNVPEIDRYGKLVSLPIGTMQGRMPKGTSEEVRGLGSF